ncbi:hypothetical protein [Chitinophaga pinensis]|uniref:Uncharacterized protein n=1 Tax=Chitinophaga pinensis (strain ATCC 43595 / DSM 2588 / LMG 13176 / NBRC 15968 / NCIMB 11800 / UQM 2034) TaxID=485918 RepID=A0A979G694_CHIPD|nr:hypothetical protein [Chitinophaga pinensis]ACU61453.1 hypothetical protein Cpin_3991 [Chitinophaga pinensis DSM 2588]
MAKQQSIITFTGKLGPQIGYERNGKYFLRGAPQIVRQTIATRKAAKRFGIASRKSRLIRNACYHELDVRCDSSHVNRLNSLLIAANGDNAAINGFRFNQQIGIDRFLPVKPTLSGNDELYIPAQEIPPYGRFSALEIKAIAVRIDFDTRRVTGTDTVVTTIYPGKPFEGLTIPLFVAGEGTLILTLQVRGMRQDGPSRDQRYVAADVIAVIPPEAIKRFKVHTHIQRATTHLYNTPLPVHTYRYPAITQLE